MRTNSLRDREINVISLFNGMSTGRQALVDEGFKIGKYYSSEIKPYAIELAQHHFPDTIQLGDVTKWQEWDINWGEIDLVLSGSPCTDLSLAGNREGLQGKESSLFWQFIAILNKVREYNPNVIFLQENVVGADKKDIGIMSRAMGVYPCTINSRLVTAQNRDRYYWTNIRTKKTLFDIVTDIPQPEDRGIMFQDILENGYTDLKKAPTVTEREYKNKYKDLYKLKQWILKKKESGWNVPQHAITEDGGVRNLTKVEFCRLQGFPDNYCDIISWSKSVSLLGDGWTLPVIRHIFSFIE